MGRNFVDVSRVPLKQFTSAKSPILLIKKFFFLVRFIDDITGGKCADGEGGECTLLYCLYGDVNIFKGIAALNRVWILGFFYCPKQGQVFKPSAAQFHPNITRRVTTPSPFPEKLHSDIKHSRGVIITTKIMYIIFGLSDNRSRGIKVKVICLNFDGNQRILMITWVKGEIAIKMGRFVVTNRTVRLDWRKASENKTFLKAL